MQRGWTPTDIKRVSTGLPDQVMNTWNEQILKNWNAANKNSPVNQAATAQIIADRMGVPLADVISNGWNNVAQWYGDYGWVVTTAAGVQTFAERTGIVSLTVVV